MPSSKMHLLDSGYMSDCSFLVGPDQQKINAHQLHLSRASEVFQTQFHGSLPKTENIMEPDATVEAFKLMLKYIYTGEVSLESVQIALQVCCVAHKYMLKSLTENCIVYIKENLDAENICCTLEFAQLISNEELQDFCLQRLRSCATEVMVADTWVEATSNTVKLFLQQEHLNVDTEVSLLYSCVRWSKHQLELGDATDKTLRDVMSSLLPHIRFLVISAKQFVEFNIIHPGVLTHKERYHVLASINMHSPKLLLKNFSPCHDIRCRQSPFSSRYDKTQLTDVAFVYSAETGWHASADQRIYFTAKMDALVFGITYQAKSDLRDGPVSRLQCDLYNEKVYVALFSEEKEKKMCHVWLKRKIKFGSLVDIDFPETCAMKKGNRYSLRMFFYLNLHFPALDFSYISNKNFFKVEAEQKYKMCHITNIFVTET